LNAEHPVVVVGAGAGGIAAAIAAARAGARVLLVERGRAIGGTVVHSLIHTLGGLYDDAGRIINGGLAAELADALLHRGRDSRQRRLGRTWVLNACPMLYQELVTGWIGSLPGITVALETWVDRVTERSGRIEMVTLGSRSGVVTVVAPRAVVDATGTCAVVRLVDPALVVDREPAAAGGLIVVLRGVEPGTLEAPRGLAHLRALRAAAAEGSLPAGCQHVWLDHGVRSDEVYVKLAVPTVVISARSASLDAERDAVVELLRRQPGFSSSYVAATGAPGIRDGGRVVGECMLSEDDVRSGRKFADRAARCAWPIERWDPHGSVALEYLPSGLSYDVPLRALHVRGLANLWTAGKTVSADACAQASARVVGTCWAMGEAVGRAAAATTAPALASASPHQQPQPPAPAPLP
jgi:hypothetical protein